MLCAVLAGIGVYYTQVYAYYIEVEPSGVDDVQLTPKGSDVPETVLYGDFRAIEKKSSPIGYRACFTTDTPLAQFTDRYEEYVGSSPRVAPGWFDCFDAEEIGTMIANGQARVFTGQRNLFYGIDRVVAITENGRGFIWHEVNECGAKTYDGSPKGEDCPPRDGET
nr:DUF6446 family protein [Thalassococcus arenae]